VSYRRLAARARISARIGGLHLHSKWRPLGEEVHTRAAARVGRGFDIITATTRGR